MAPETDEDTRTPERGSPAALPRWAKVLGVAVVALLILAFVVLHLTGAVGPGAH